MITLYEKTEANFTHNGLCALDNNVIAPIVTEELNGLFMLEFDYPTRAPYAQEIITERLVKCPVPDMNNQLFRIAYVKKQLSGITHFTAYHVFYDLVDNLIEDTFVVNKNGQQAITQILGAAQYEHPFTASSNIPTYENARMARLNPAEVLLNADIDNGFLARWGGEIIRDNFHVYMQTVRGSNNGVAIRDKKNLTGYSSDVDVQAVCTRIMPQGFDGLFLPEKYVDSPRINKYIKPKIRVIKYDSVKAAVGQYENAEDALPLSQAYDELRKLANQEFSSGHIDVPLATYCVTFAQLANTEEYKNFAALETVNIGDTVTVIHEEDGFETTARMVGYQYNPLTQAYINVTLGNYMPKFTDIAKDIKRVETGVSQALTEANYALLSANGKNTNFYGSVTPANPRSGDLWFKDNGDKMELWVYETRDGVTGWYPLLTDLTMEEMKAELAKAAEEVSEAKAKSEEALAIGEAAQAAGDEALAIGQAAQNAANQAHSESQNALIRANQAFDDAVAALDKANSVDTLLVTVSKTQEQMQSDLLIQNDLINLRVSKNDVINQINISTEGILISGNRIHITGTTTIDNSVIQTAMIANLAVTTAKMADLSVSTAKIADAAINNAKIANLDAGKINTGTLSADRIAAGSITSAKLTIANGYITNAMIANATIQSAKIAAIDAGKITTGTLSAARIGAGSITSDKVTSNFLQTLTGSSSIRITGTTISYYNGSSLTSQINSNGFELTRDSTKIGRIGTNNITSQTSWRGLVFDLEYAGNYMCWAWRSSSSASTYTTKLTYYRSKLQNGMEKGFHFDDVVYFKGNLGVASGSSTVTTQVHYWTLGSTNCYAMRTSTGKAGFAMDSGNLILGDDGQWVDFGIIREICKKLAGKTISLPSGFNSSGQATSWYNPIAFNDMTWWTT